MRRREIEVVIEESNPLEAIDIKEVAKEAKLGLLKRLIVIAVWPLIKTLIARRLSPVLVDIIDRILNGI